VIQTFEGIMIECCLINIRDCLLWSGLVTAFDGSNI
jgi:hypothetical protein